jgi:glycosyltransferase involved in cell wall biosynthesis
MKIIFLLPSLEVSGATVLFEIIDRLADRGHKINLTSLDEKIPVEYPLKVSPRKLQNCVKLFEEADVIISYYPACAFYVNDLDTQAKKIHFITEDNRTFYSKEVFKAKFPKLDKDRINFEFELQQNYLEAVYNLPVSFISTNKDLVNMLEKQYKKKAYFMPIGVNKKLFYPDLAVPKGSRLRVLVEGNNLPWKGINDINRALSDLRGFELWTMSNTKFTIKSDKHWINPTVEDTRKILSSCDILIRGHYVDGIANLQAQAMACGSVVLTRETPGSKVFCKHKKNSLVFKAKDKKLSSEAIKTNLKLLLKNKKLREELIRGGFETAKKLKWSKSIDVLEKVLKGVKNGSRGK